tara:strand:- start:281 stop:5890 length:5610 start_codon:yes stop_codon:yes gene_type:complete
MAKQNKQSNQNTSNVETNTFLKGLNKDSDPSFVKEGMWTHARNASNNTASGDLGTISNEESNILCAKVMTVSNFTNKDIIGNIHLFSDKWVIYSVLYDQLDGKPLRSEIGLFEEDTCKYRLIVNDPCLNFNKLYLITGASRLKDDCSWEVYWADDLNPDRHLNIGDPKLWIKSPYEIQGGVDGSDTINYYANGNGLPILWPGVPWIEECNEIVENPQGEQRLTCRICNPTNKLDCNELRIARLFKTPCLNLKKGLQPGTLGNGSYAVTMAYTIDRVRVTNYFSVGYPQPIYFDPDLRGSLEVDVDVDENAFDEFELILIRFTNQNLDSRRIGYYSTRTKNVIIDLFTDQNPNIDQDTILLKDYVFEQSKQITAANDYLLRIGPTSKFDFNYQPLANLIQAEWISVEYDEKYYFNGGKNAGYLRDEIYAYFIRWVYDTGDKSASYHIPGRPSGEYVTPANIATTDTATLTSDNNLGTTTLYEDDQIFQVLNTASQISSIGELLEDGGKIIASGTMGYWESSEVYPDDRPDIWNSSEYCWTGSTSENYDLCGEQIRHHKFPDNALSDETNHFKRNSIGDYNIRLMGVRFKNIIMPKDNEGNDIDNIVGYEILRGSRNGNKTILAKGIINNFRNYSIQGTPENDQGGAPTIGLYANYPYNCLIPRSNTTIAQSVLGVLQADYFYNDPFIIRRSTGADGIDAESRLSQNIPIDIQSFHSPDLSYNNPTISASELKVYGYLNGRATQKFIEPDKHPEFKLIGNEAVIFAFLGGLINLVLETIGELKINYPEQNYTVPRHPVLRSSGVTPSTQASPGATITGLPKADYENAVYATPLNTALGLKGLAVGAGGLSAGTGIKGWEEQVQQYANGGAFFTDVLLGQTKLVDKYTNNSGPANQFRERTGTYTTPAYLKTYKAYELLPTSLKAAATVVTGLSQSFYYFIEGMKDTVDVLYSIIRTRQYALQQIGHGEYTNFVESENNQNALNMPTNNRFRVPVGSYVKDQLFQFPTYQVEPDSYNFSSPSTPYNGTEVNYRINNLLRPDLVVIRTTDDNENPAGPAFLMQDSQGQLGIQSYDQSSMTLGLVNKTTGYGWGTGNNAFKPENKSNEFTNQISSHYVGLKYNFRNLYRQLESIVQVLVTPCEQKLDFISQNSTVANSVISQSFPGTCNDNNFNRTRIAKTPVFFGGDTYVTRHTEKTIMPFFYEWLYGEPDNYRFNYFRRQNIPEPRFMVNSNKWDISNFSISNLLNVFQGDTPDYGEGILPRSYYDLDNFAYSESLNFTFTYPGLLAVKNSYFYTSSSGIKDFFVESEVLTDFRFKGRSVEQKSYNKWEYTDLLSLFSQNPAVLTKGNYFRYDYSLSVSRFLFSQYYNNGALQGSTYDPTVSELCYTTFPNRIQYSNVLTEHAAYDAWLMFLALNKVDFKSELNSVKSYGKTGLMMTFKNNSPLIYQGVDERESYIGVKATIGDGGLFSTTPQNIVVSDQPYQYGSCQNIYSVISTPAGIYFISQEQGKIFAYTGKLEEISQTGMKWWFDKFLPFKLTEEFPEYPYTDNPIAGIGCQATYDNANTILYFSKTDYMVKDEYKGLLTFDADSNKFSLDGKIFRILLGDSRYFKDASWTVSYDPKTKLWISFHDWIPGSYLPSKLHFLTTKKDGIWKHNDACNDYCNFYNVQYPFEIELPIVTGQTITTMRSVQYILECYRKDVFLCTDQFHVLDYNFNQAIITNTEQVSGILNLNIFPKNNVTLSQTYPKLNSNLDSFDILFSKEENKYRFNQFWDITKDRGEFPEGYSYPPTGPLIPNSTKPLGNYAENQIWITEPNGYVKNLNADNLNYNKPLGERKKFRHYLNYVKLVKENSRDTNMILKIFNTKSQISNR